MKILIDEIQTEAREDDTVLAAMLRAGLHPTGGGCLCTAGDCPHCLVSVDGVAYTRACQTKAYDGMKIERSHHGDALPALVGEDAASVDARHLHCDVVVVGQGAAGREAARIARGAGKDVVVFDARDGQEVVGVYQGPLVVARTDEGTLCVRVRGEVIIATGASEIQPIAPGAHLPGLLTPRAAETLQAAGIDLGEIVRLSAEDGEIVRFEGDGGEGDERAEAVIVRDPAGDERRLEGDTFVVDLGRTPRDTLLRMGRGAFGGIPPVRAVGDAAEEASIPSCPRAGTVCPCSGVTVDDLEQVWDQGFHELELVKRATLAGTGTCQGSVCTPHVRSFLQEKGKTLQAPFTARPVARQLTIAEVAAGAWHRPTPRTSLHDEHVALGARMERTGGWRRPWDYGDPKVEYRAVREAVSLGDVGTLGKFLVAGPDALAFLEQLYPTKVKTIRPGRSRYVLLLDERGYVLDDGLICREKADRDDEDRFYVTLTSAGSSFGEMWLRDWAEGLGFDVLIMNQTASLGAINVTGPRAAELLVRAGAESLPEFGRHASLEIAGVGCRVLRLSFTGELSYELHHPAVDSVRLWRALMHLGEDLGVAPHGLGVLMDLRLEKGHPIVGLDTAFDSTPRRLDHEWAIRMEKDDFIGRPGIVRTDKIELDRRLVGLETESPAPPEGSVIRFGGEHVGEVASSTDSPILGKAVMLAWLDLRDDELPEQVEIAGRPARRVALPFYDPQGERARVNVEIDLSAKRELPSFESPKARRFEPLEMVRILAAPEVLDSLDLDSTHLRLAPDEILVAPYDRGALPDDVSCIVERETGFSGAWIAAAEAMRFLERACAWELPQERPAFAQGMIAGLPLKLCLEENEIFFVVQSCWVADLEERMRGSEE